MHAEIIERLRDDKDYYGDFGKQYMSNSDIGTLLTNPKQYGVSLPDNANFAKGRYFHQLILELRKRHILCSWMSPLEIQKHTKNSVPKQG